MTALSNRRTFIKGSTLVIGATALSSFAKAKQQQISPVRVGLVTDLHYADKPPAGSRHYRETLAKFAEAAEKFQQKELSFLVELGDFIDAADTVDTELAYLRRINQEFSAACDERHYVLGNHCVDTLTKEEFLGEVGQQRSYYSFDRHGYHFVVLDACFRTDGTAYGRKNFQWTDTNIPPEELEWLAADLRATDKPTVVFAHQRLDVSTDHGVKNNSEVRKVLSGSGKIQAVFQGHSHKNDLIEIDGIPYCTLVAMVEGQGTASSGYSILELLHDGTLELNGFRKQDSHQWQNKAVN